MGDFKRKQEEIELNTYWKIDDYRKLLLSRISETHMKDYVSEETTKLSNLFKDLLDKRVNDLTKNLTGLEHIQQQLRHHISDRLEEVRRGHDNAMQM